MDQATAQAHLDDALLQLSAARKAVAYGVGDQTKTAQSLRELGEQVTYWQRIVDSFTAAASGVSNHMAAVPRFR